MAPTDCRRRRSSSAAKRPTHNYLDGPITKTIHVFGSAYLSASGDEEGQVIHASSLRRRDATGMAQNEFRDQRKTARPRTVTVRATSARNSARKCEQACVWPARASPITKRRSAPPRARPNPARARARAR